MHARRGCNSSIYNETARDGVLIIGADVLGDWEKRVAELPRRGPAGVRGAADSQLTAPQPGDRPDVTGPAPGSGRLLNRGWRQNRFHKIPLPGRVVAIPIDSRRRSGSSGDHASV